MNAAHYVLTGNRVPSTYRAMSKERKGWTQLASTDAQSPWEEPSHYERIA